MDFIKVMDMEASYCVCSEENTIAVTGMQQHYNNLSNVQIPIKPIQNHSCNLTDAQNVPRNVGDVMLLEKLILEVHSLKDELKRINVKYQQDMDEVMESHRVCKATLYKMEEENKALKNIVEQRNIGDSDIGNTVNCQSQTVDTRSNRLCYFYNNKKCKFGKNCIYKHGLVSCRYGKNCVTKFCAFSHGVKTPMKNIDKTPMENEKVKSKHDGLVSQYDTDNKLCYFFNNSSCHYGSNCRYRHKVVICKYQSDCKTHFCKYRHIKPAQLELNVVEPIIMNETACELDKSILCLQCNTNNNKVLKNRQLLDETQMTIPCMMYINNFKLHRAQTDCTIYSYFMVQFIGNINNNNNNTDTEFLAKTEK